VELTQVVCLELLMGEVRELGDAHSVGQALPALHHCLQVVLLLIIQEIRVSVGDLFKKVKIRQKYTILVSNVSRLAWYDQPLTV